VEDQRAAPHGPAGERRGGDRHRPHRHLRRPSKYQLVIDRLDYAGEGALLARIERLRLRLLEEGLFDPERKRPIPMLPRVIGVVTSERGAVIQDIRTTVARRFPRRILLWPVAVQGAGAADQIAAAIEGFGALPLDGPVPRPDVLIVARGGGSLEDLMAFNEEVVVRAAAACPIPLISAVGHETDTTLIDFASDRRAPTPTCRGRDGGPPPRGPAGRRGAARSAAPARPARCAGALAAAPAGRGARAPGPAGHPRRPAPAHGGPGGASGTRPARPFGPQARRARPPGAAPAAPARGHRQPARGPRALFGRTEVGAQRLLARGRASKALVCFSPAPVRALLRENTVRLDGAGARLGSVSYQAVLARGFALVQDAEGATLTAAADVPAGERLVLTFADGQVGTTADGAKPGRRRDGREASSQGALL
jgi:exodeoxyribonuclease VII large subunit